MLNRNETERGMCSCPYEEVRTVVVEHSNPQVVFLLRERSAIINYLGETRLKLCGRLFLFPDCMLVLLIFKVGRYLSRIYSTWWNYHLPDQARAFRLMQRQELVAFHCHGDNGRRDRSFLAENSCRALFARANRQAVELQPWSPAVFEKHRQRIISQTGSVEALWIEDRESGAET